jgi:hypothetical protein
MTTLYDQAREKLAAIEARDAELRAWEVEFNRTDPEYYDWFLDQIQEERTAK